MAVYPSIQALKNEINDTIYDNSAGLVTAPAVQERMHDIIDTMNAISTSVAGVKTYLEGDNDLSQIKIGSSLVATQPWVQSYAFPLAGDANQDVQVKELEVWGDLKVHGEMVAVIGQTIPIDDAFVLLNSGNSEADSGVQVDIGGGETSRIFREAATDLWKLKEGAGSAYTLFHEGNRSSIFTAGTAISIVGSTLSVSLGTGAAQAAAGNHSHTGVYAAYTHNHDGVYATAGHNHDGVYATAGHNHDATYAAISHTHPSYAPLASPNFTGTPQISGAAILTTNNLAGGNGIAYTDPHVSVDLASGSGMKFVSGKLACDIGTGSTQVAAGNHSHSGYASTTGFTMVGDINARAIKAVADSAYDIGQDGVRFANGYFENVDSGTGRFTDNVYLSKDSAILHMAGGTTVSQPKLIIGEQNNYGVALTWDGGTKAYLDRYWATSVTGTPSSHLMTFDVQNSRVGIKETSPSYDLDVDGVIRGTILRTDNYQITESDGDLLIKYGSTVIGKYDQSANEWLFKGNVKWGQTL